MKSKKQKREEAIERNLRNMHVRPEKYRDLPLDICRRYLGIPKDNTDFDEEILNKQRAMRKGS